MLVGQEVFHEVINQENGLVANEIYDIYKDRKGYVWCTTADGIIKYNGNRFQSFSSASNLSLAGSNIKEDQYGRIWYQSFDGYFFYIQNNVLHELPFIKTSGFKPYVIKDDCLYFVSDEGICKTNLRTLKTTLFIKGEGYEYCHSLNNKLYFGDNIIQCYNFANQTAKVFQTISHKFKSLNSFILNNQIYIGDRIDPSTPFYLIQLNRKIKKFELNLNQTVQHVYFTNNSYWFFTPNGIYSYDQQMLPSKTPTFLRHKNVSSITKDLDGSFWIGSPISGIFVIKDLLSREYTLQSDEFSAISQKNGIIYSGTKSGKIYKYTSNSSPKLFFDTKTNHPIYYMNFNLFPNWFFFTGNGLNAVNSKTKQRFLNSLSVKDIFKIDNNTISFAATGVWGVTTISELLNATIPTSSSIMQIRAKSCVYDSILKVHYVASNKGLYIIQHGKKEFLQYKKQAILCQWLLIHENKVYGLLNNGEFFMIQNKQFTPINSNLKFRRLKVHNQRIYLSTRNEIYEFFQNKIVKIRALNNNIKIIDFEIVGNELFLVSPQKLIALSLNSIKSTKEKPQIYLSSVLFNDHKIDQRLWNQIPFSNNSITILPEIVNFDNQNDYEFFYLINGKKYMINETNPTLNLPSLSPGVYKITILGGLKSTQRIVAIKRFPVITILPPFWKRGWFISLISAIVFMGFYVIYRLRININEKKNEILMNQLELENKLKDSRLQLIKSQMNPHFFFNSLNNIQSYIFTNETKEASLYLSKLSRLTRKILEFSDVNSISIKDEMEALQLYLEIQKMRFADLAFKITFEGKENPDNVHVPTMLFQPYVENSILHGLSHSSIQKNLNIHFHLISSQKLIVTIEDNGIGREKSQEINAKNSNKAASFATKANLERIQLLNKDHYNIQINYADLNPEYCGNKGTVVTITIQLK